MYADAESGARDPSVTLSIDTLSTLADSLGLAILQIADLHLGPNDDFFNAGMNSLHVLKLSAVIRRGLSEVRPQADQSAITPKLIYANPSLGLLSTAIFQSINVNLQNGHAEAETQEQVFRALVNKYTTDSPIRDL